MRVAFVTGAAAGLGAAIAAALAADGYRVVLGDVDPAVAATAAALGAPAVAECFDVRDRAAFGAAIERTVQRDGRLDVLINNAARTVSRSIWEIDAAEWDDVMAVNLRSVLFGCQLAGAVMRAARRGRIVNIASYAGQHPSPASGAHYAASKAGVLMLTKLFASELAPDAVTVNAIAPSAIVGPQLERAPEARKQALLAAVPLQRFGVPEDVCAAVRYLISDAAGYVTGTTLDINGGRAMR
ncbi:MAG: SDR family oxidoreductase [Lautropia sp.]